MGEGEMYREERDVLEMRKVDEYDMEIFIALDDSEITIAIRGDRWWPREAKRGRG